MPEENRNRIRKYAIELLALAVLIPLSVYLTFYKDGEKESKEIAQEQKREISNELSPIPTDNKEEKDIESVKSPAATSQKYVRLEIQSPVKNYSYAVKIDSEVTVANLLQEAQKEGLKLKTKDYGPALGLFVEAINEMENDNKKQLYWQFYVNGKRSAVGASTAKVSPGDTVSWKLEKQAL